LSETEERRGTLRSAWRHKPFRALLTAYAISSSGDFIYIVALMAYVFDRTGSATWVAAVAGVRVLPFVIFGPLGGVIAGRYDRRRVMVISDVARAVVMVLLALVTAAKAPVAVAIALAFCNNVATTPWRPAAVAVTPDVVGEDDLAAANAVEATITQLALFIGPAIGALLFAATSASISFLVNGASFLLSAVLISRVREASGRPSVVEDDAGDAGEERSSWRDDFVAGWSAMRKTSGVLLLQLLLVSVLFAYGFEVVTHPLVAAQRLGIGAEGAGFLLGGVGVGGLLIAPVSGRIAASPRAGTALAASAVLLGAPFALLAFVRSPALACALMLVEGVGNIVFEVVVVTLLQRLLRGDDLARASGLQDSASAAAMVAGTLIAPVLVQTVGLQAAVVVGGLSVAAFGVLAAPRLSRLGAELAAKAEALRPVVDGLGRIGLFDGASRAALERLAADVSTERVPPETLIVAQGEPADDLYVIRDGRLRVMARGEDNRMHALPTLGTDEWFGEIGLLHGVPRTATVTSDTEVELWRIPGKTFLEALTGIDARPAALERGLGVRLGRTHPRLARAGANEGSVASPTDSER
jgi:predicted MFS family arabinose efflux permease